MTTTTHCRQLLSAVVLAIAARATPVRSQTLAPAPPASVRLAKPALTHDKLMKVIWLNQQAGTSQEIIGPAATVLHLTQNEDLLVHGLTCALREGHSIDFAQLRSDADGFVFTETNREGNFMFHVDGALNPLAAARIIGATSISPLEVVALSLDDPEAQANLDATLSAWAAIIDKLVAARNPAAGRP
jgi:hypothetical protein